ncbi:MAG: hypothetical protein ACK5JT_22155, partial [Hyphomicrobiaceae bacterium]
DAIARLRAWTRARFDLGTDQAVVITENEVILPGCPPIETIVAFWDEGNAETRYHFKVFKPAVDVTEADLPPKWLKPGLIDIGLDGCNCC